MALSASFKCSEMAPNASETPDRLRGCCLKMGEKPFARRSIREKGATGMGRQSGTGAAIDSSGLLATENSGGLNNLYAMNNSYSAAHDLRSEAHTMVRKKVNARRGGREFSRPK
jgi:hypothetical protein